MKKGSKIFIFIVIVVILIITIVTILLNCKSNKEKKSIAFDTSIMKQSNEKLEIDDYTIILTHYICDKDMGVSAAVFKVKKSNGKPEADDIVRNKLEFGVFGNRFNFIPRDDVYAEYKGNDLYLYLVNRSSTGVRKDRLEDVKDITLKDYATDKKSIFELSDTEEPVLVKPSNDIEYKLSSLGIYMSYESFENVKNMKIVLKNGEEKKIKDSKINLFSDYEYLHRKQVVFDSPVNLKKIKYMVVNGEKINVNKAEKKSNLNSYEDKILCEGLSCKMLKCTFDKETGIGIAEMQVESDDAKIDTGGNSIEYNGNSYYVLLSKPAGFSSYYEKKDDKIHVDFSFTAYEDSTQDTFIGIYKNGDRDNTVGKFKISDRYNSNAIMYFGKDKNIVLSNIGIKMVGEKFKDENVVYLVNKSGKRKEIKIVGGCEAGRYHAYEFGKYIDITGVETIENGDVEYIKSE